MKLMLYRAENLEMVNLEGNMNPWLRVVGRTPPGARGEVKRDALR